jgi:hypothetical protein
MTSHVRLTVASLLLTLTAAPWAADAAEGKKSAYLTSSWRLAISAFPPELDGSLRVDPDVGRGTPLKLDRDLHLDEDNVVPRLDLTWRLTPHHRLDLNYFQLDSSGTRAFSEQVTFGNTTFDANASLHAELKYKLGQLVYGWSFINDGRKELGVSIGAQLIGVDAELRGEAGGQQRVQDADTLVGAPLLGLYGAFAFTPDLVLAAQVQWLDVSWSDYDIILRQASVEADWRFSKWAGLNAGYAFYNYDISTDSGDFRGRAELDLRGPRLGLSFYF